jgi:hypothetical protein
MKQSSPKVFNYILLVICLLLNIQTLWGQEMQWGELEDIPNRKQYSSVLQTQGSQTWLARSRFPDISSKLYIEKFNDSLSKIESFKLKGQDRNGVVVRMFVYAKYMVVFRAVYSLLDGKNFLYAEMLTPQGKFINRIEIDQSRLKNYGDRGDFIVTESKNLNRLLTFFTNYDENGNIIGNITVLDSSLNTIYKKKLKLDYESDDPDVRQLETDSSGNFYMLSSEANDTKKKKETLPTKNWLHIYKPLTNTFSQRPLDVAPYILLEHYLTLREDSQLLIINGLYALKNTSTIEGNIYITYRLNDDRINIYQTLPFSPAFKKLALGEKQYEKDPEIRDLFIRKVSALKDGSSIVIAERIFISQQSQNYISNGHMQTSYRSVYNYNEILMMNISSTGDLLWRQVIPKKQTSLNDVGLYTSFVCSEFADRLLFHFNKQEKDSQDIMEYTLYFDGKLQSRVFTTQGENDILIIPEECKQMEDGTIIFSMNYNKQFTLLRAKYPY